MDIEGDEADPEPDAEDPGGDDAQPDDDEPETDGDELSGFDEARGRVSGVVRVDSDADGTRQSDEDGLGGVDLARPPLTPPTWPGCAHRRSVGGVGARHLCG